MNNTRPDLPTACGLTRPATIAALVLAGAWAWPQPAAAQATATASALADYGVPGGYQTDQHAVEASARGVLIDHNHRVQVGAHTLNGTLNTSLAGSIDNQDIAYSCCSAAPQSVSIGEWHDWLHLTNPATGQALGSGVVHAVMYANATLNGNLTIPAGVDTGIGSHGDFTVSLDNFRNVVLDEAFDTQLQTNPLRSSSYNQAGPATLHYDIPFSAGAAEVYYRAGLFLRTAAYPGRPFEATAGGSGWLWWGGITSVTDNAGHALSWSVSANSGLNYAVAASSPVPEPTTGLLLAAGLALGCARAGRGRRHERQAPCAGLAL